MEFKLRTYSKVNGKRFHLADMIIHNNEIVQFKEAYGSTILNESNRPILPLKLKDAQFRFLEKYHKDFDLFNLKIKFPDNSVYGFKLTSFEKFRLKWLLKKYWVQKNENIKWIIALIIASLIGIWKIFSS